MKDLLISLLVGLGVYLAIRAGGIIAIFALAFFVGGLDGAGGDFLDYADSLAVILGIIAFLVAYYLLSKKSDAA